MVSVLKYQRLILHQYSVSFFHHYSPLSRAPVFVNFLNMRYSTAILRAVAFCISEVSTFPAAAAIEYVAKVEKYAAASANIEGAIAKHRSTRTVGFNVSAKYVSTHGQYEFVVLTFLEATIADYS